MVWTAPGFSRSHSLAFARISKTCIRSHSLAFVRIANQSGVKTTLRPTPKACISYYIGSFERSSLVPQGVKSGFPKEGFDCNLIFPVRIRSHSLAFAFGIAQCHILMKSIDPPQCCSTSHWIVRFTAWIVDLFVASCILCSTNLFDLRGTCSFKSCPNSIFAPWLIAMA